MPVIQLEYSANLSIDHQIKKFISELHEVLVAEIKTDLRTCRTRIDKCENYVIADGDARKAFIMLNIRMLPGRTEKIKNHLGELLLQKINHDFSDEIAKHDTQIRVYLTETETEHYYGLGRH